MRTIRLRSTLGTLAAAALALAPGRAQAQGTLYVTVDGYASPGRFGQAIASAGDADADGRDDLLVGASRQTGPLGPNQGAAYVISGATGALIQSVEGEDVGHRLGAAVAGIGDIDGDGADDFAVGAPGFSNQPFQPNYGRVYAYSGATGTLLWTVTGQAIGEYLGYAVAGGGDYNGDSVDDVAIGVPGRTVGASPNRGQVTVHRGQTGLLFATFSGQSTAAFFGGSIDFAGDLDGDGDAEVLVGAYGQSGAMGPNQGRVYVYRGGTGTLLAQIDGEALADQFGAWVAGVGDMDGDGDLEFAASAGRHAGPAGLNQGRVYVYSGAAATPLFTIDGEAAQDQFGGVQDFVGEWALGGLAGPGDLDGDGLADLAVGARFHAGPLGANQGRVYAYSGAGGAPALLFSADGETAQDQFGTGLGAAGDWNGDGRADLAGGSPIRSGPLGVQQGKVYVYGIPAPGGCTAVAGTGRASGAWLAYLGVLGLLGRRPRRI